MHVCHLVHHLANGGLEQQILELVRQSDDEVEYTVCYLDEDDSLAGEMREAGGTVVGLDVTSGPRSVFNPLAVWKLSAFLREQEFDILHVHTPLYVQVMGRIAAAFGGPEHVVGTYHNPRENFHPAMRYLESATRRLSSVNVGVSLAVERSFTGSATKYEPGQGLPGASCTIYNGIDVDAFAERVSSADADAVREEYGLEDETVFLNIGRYSEQKAQKDLIRAMEYVVEEIPDSHLFIVGWGPLEEELRQTVCEYGLQEYITVTGKVPTVEEYYAVADV
ncbi:MAG: glycosyltransferase, partial [Halovenus sp.]